MIEYTKVKESQILNLAYFKGGSVSKSISDVIEEFIMSSLDDEDFIELSRNDLAKFFACVPSQINYVLNTRFTINRGFVIESQRGGGGYIKLLRIQDNKDNFLKNALNLCREPITALQANQLLCQMIDKKVISEREANIIKAMLSPKALNSPINIDNNLRASIMSELIIELMKKEN